MKTIKEVHQEYSDKVKQAKKDKFLLGLNNLSPSEKSAIRFFKLIPYCRRKAKPGSSVSDIYDN